jgi:hypothetical protein
MPTNEDEIVLDLEERKERNETLKACKRELERIVLSFEIDWVEFHNRLADDEIEDCHHDHRHCHRVLAAMGVDEKEIEGCLLYFRSIAQQCDCKVYFNVDMTDVGGGEVDRKGGDCADCGADYGEFYMVHDHVWSAAGDPDGRLCIGCLEHRLGRKLCCGDFNDAPCNSLEGQSLRLLDRLATK